MSSKVVDGDEDLYDGLDYADAKPPSGIGILDAMFTSFSTVGRVGTLKSSGEIIFPNTGFAFTCVLNDFNMLSFSILASSDENPSLVIPTVKGRGD